MIEPDNIADTLTIDYVHDAFGNRCNVSVRGFGIMSRTTYQKAESLSILAAEIEEENWYS